MLRQSVVEDLTKGQPAQGKQSTPFCTEPEKKQPEASPPEPSQTDVHLTGVKIPGLESPPSPQTIHFSIPRITSRRLFLAFKICFSLL